MTPRPGPPRRRRRAAAARWSPDWLAEPPPASHVVLLARDRAFLGRCLRTFVSRGLVKGDGLLLVTSASARQALAQGLAAEGLDAEKLARRGQLTLLSAESTLPQLLSGGMPERVRFEAVAGAAIRAARARHRVVRVFGDMVDLLWRHRLAAAVALEEMWEELVAAYRFPVLCNYSVDCFEPGAYRGIVQTVSRVHSHLFPAADPGLFAEAVDQAMSTVVGPPDCRVRTWLRHGPRNRWAGTPARMPEGAVALLRLSETLPVLGAEVLSRARQHYLAEPARRRRPAGRARRPFASNDGMQRLLVEKLRAHDTLARSRDELRALSARLVSLREADRTRVANDLNENVAQLLAAIKIDVTLACRRLGGSDSRGIRAARQRLEAATTLLDESIRGLQRLATELRPGVLDSLGLAAAIKWQAGQFEAHSGIPCRVSDALGEVRPGTETATAALRVLQEALAQVARRSAKAVRVRLGKRASDLMLEVRAQGARRTATNPSRALGIVEMRERALDLGGAFTLRTDAQGTVLRLRLPLTLPPASDSATLTLRDRTARRG